MPANKETLRAQLDRIETELEKEFSNYSRDYLVSRRNYLQSLLGDK